MIDIPRISVTSGGVERGSHRRRRDVYVEPSSSCPEVAHLDQAAAEPR